jgi:hypothetical protein
VIQVLQLYKLGQELLLALHLKAVLFRFASLSIAIYRDRLQVLILAPKITFLTFVSLSFLIPPVGFSPPLKQETTFPYGLNCLRAGGAADNFMSPLAKLFAAPPLS